MLKIKEGQTYKQALAIKKTEEKQNSAHVRRAVRTTILCGAVFVLLGYIGALEYRIIARTDTVAYIPVMTQRQVVSPQELLPLDISAYEAAVAQSKQHYDNQALDALVHETAGQ